MPQHTKTALLWAGVLCLWTLLIFSSCLDHTLLGYDDAIYITHNPTIQGLSPAHLQEIIADELYGGGIFPLPFISYAIEYHFFGSSPWIYHVDNLLLHTANALLVFVLIYLLSARTALAFLTAMLFSIHPLRVESVAWVAERKDVLYAFFYLGALVCYVRAFQKNNGRGYMMASCLLFAGALFSKPQAITLPAVLLAVDVLLKRGTWMKLCVEKWPYVLLAAAYYLFWMMPHTHLLSATDPRIAGPLEKVLLAFHALLIYISKTFFPIDLSCMYPFPHKIDGHFPVMVYWSWAVTIAAGYLVFWFFRKDRLVLFGAFFFLINMLMPLKLIWHNWFVGEHYTYLAGIGAALALAVVVLKAIERSSRHMAVLGVILVSAYVLSLSGQTAQYTQVWKDDIALWTHAIKVNPHDLRTAFAYWYRGVAYDKKGEYALALADCDKALSIYPDLIEARRTRAEILSKMQVQ